MLRVSLLGDFCVQYGEMPVRDIETPRLQSLLAYLLLHRSAPQSRAYLAFLFWPDTNESQARTNLRNLLHHLRHALPNSDTYLDVTVQTMQWRSDAPFSLDIIDFNTEISQAEQALKQNSPLSAREAFIRAADLYKGDLLPSCYDEWIISHREGLRQSYLDVLERLGNLLEEQRDYQGAIRNTQQLLRYDPLHEAAYRRLIRLHALNDDRAGALRVYHTCTTVLQRELEVEPSAATREVYQQLLSAEARQAPTVPATTSFTPLIGREKEWTQMLQNWHAVVSGKGPQVIMLCGEAGIGKTRLAEDLLQWAGRQGISRANSRCFAAEGELAFGPVIALLRAHPLIRLEDAYIGEVARLLPEILAMRPDLPRPTALTEAWQRQRLFEALAQAILSINQPLLLMIDDLQWCDRDTLEWLHFLLRFDRSARMLVVGTYRPEEIDMDHPLISWLHSLRLAGQVSEIDLGPLDENATYTLATRIAGADIGRQAAHHLYRETEGNPLFVVETMRAKLPAAAQGIESDTNRMQSSDFNSEGINLPPKVRSVLESRLAQVSPPTRDLTEVAAVIGREFSFKLLQKASGRDEDTLVHELDELWQRRIVREHGIEAYDFSHDKLREVAYRSMSAAHRRLLHRRIAQALEALQAEELDPVSHQLAAHYEKAGLPEKAASYYLRAANVARQVYSNAEALALLQRGLAQVKDAWKGGTVDETSFILPAQLWETIGDVHEIEVNHEDALQAYTKAQSWIAKNDRVWEARLHRKSAVALREQRLYPQALEACRRAEHALGEPPCDYSYQWEDEWLEVQVEQIWTYYWLAQWPEMDTLLNKFQPVIQAHASPALRLRFLWASCLLHLRKDRYRVSDEMLADAREGLTLSHESGSLKTRIEWNFELGFLLLWRRQLEEAEEYLNTALELAEFGKFLSMRTLSLTYLTILNRFLGRLERVLDCAARAQEAAEAAHMPDYVAAAISNRAWLDWRRGDLITVEQACQEALELWRKSPLVYPFQWQALWPLIASALAQGKILQAWSYVKALLEPTQQLLPEELDSLLQAAVRADEEGQAEVSRSLSGSSGSACPRNGLPVVCSLHQSI